MVGQSEYTREIVVLIVTDGNNKCNYVSVLGIRSRTMKIGQGRSFFMLTPIYSYIYLPACLPACSFNHTTDQWPRDRRTRHTRLPHFFFLSSIFSTTIIVFFLWRYDCIEYCNNTFDDHRHSLIYIIIIIPNI